jgi:hypothetical protein
MFALPTLISGGGQIPVVNGTIGGVPQSSSGGRKALDLAEAVSGDDSTPRTPGKLRVVENSGVCGRVICSLDILCHIHFFGRNYAGCLSGFRIW